MKVLLVDDIADNREMLEKLVNRFSKKYDVPCELFHASNGQESVDLCQKESMDLIFMDIIMPIMDGLEATKLIKQISPASMIIVISSENDEATKNKILQEGAEDYILKPFSSAIMLSRLYNYHRLVLSRNTIGFKIGAVNTFTHNVYSYHTKFFIGSEEELAQFWETLLVRLEYQNLITDLSDFVRLLYYLGSYQVKKSYKCCIYLEEDEDNFYISMDNMALLPKKEVEDGIKKFCGSVSYEMDKEIISFAVPRVVKHFDDKATENKVSPQTPKPESSVKEPKPAKEELLQTYDLLDEDTLFEFEHVLVKLQTEISMMGSSSLEMDDIDTIYEYSKQLADLIFNCNDAYAIAESLRKFSALLEDNSEDFLVKSNELANMVKSFVNDITTWKDMVFHTGAPSVDFLDQSIGSSVEMIRAVFIQEDTASEDLDDIFDF